jgi:peptidyl-prolyl cis-trans isomerase SurA
MLKFLVFLFIAGALAIASAKQLVNKVVASVNNEIILLSELNAMPGRLNRQGSIDETLLLGEKVDSLKNNTEAQLDFLIRERIVSSEVRRQGLTATPEQVNADLNQAAKRNQMSLSEFVVFMNSQGYSLDQYKEIIKNRIERQTFFEKEIISRLRITDDDAYSVFRAQFPNYRPSVSEYKIAQIFFSNQTGGAEAALRRAEAAYEKISSGSTYEQIANQVDETPGANKDGVLGTFKSGEFLPEIERAISGAAENTVSKIIEGPNGYHIVKLLNKKTILDPNFLRYKEQIKANLVQQNFERQLKNWFSLKSQEGSIKKFHGESQ